MYCPIISLFLFQSHSYSLAVSSQTLFPTLLYGVISRTEIYIKHNLEPNVIIAHDLGGQALNSGLSVSLSVQ